VQHLVTLVEFTTITVVRRHSALLVCFTNSADMNAKRENN
jgi:hypothetical protein